MASELAYYWIVKQIQHENLNLAAYHNEAGLVRGSLSLICWVLFIFWMIFFVTANVPPLWQQVVGCVLLPFGTLVKLPANTFEGTIIYMMLNTVFWATIPLIVEKCITRARQ